MDTYFDQSFIRPQKQKTYSGPAPANETVNVAERTFNADDEVICKNTRDAPWTICLAPDASTACTGGITVNAGDEVTVTASELGDTETNHFLNITNNEEIDGSYSVVVEL